MCSHATMNPTGGVRMGRDIKIMLPRDNHGYCLLVKEPWLLMTGYGLSIFGNRPVHAQRKCPWGRPPTHAGWCGGWGEKPPATD